jgi:hypothetical protein
METAPCESGSSVDLSEGSSHSTATAASRIGKRHPRCRFPGIILIVRSERSLRAMTMFWGSVRQTDEFARLDFEDGSEEVADLVIGADGVGSVVRQAVTGEPSPSIYARYVAWRGLLPNPHCRQRVPRNSSTGSPSI